MEKHLLAHGLLLGHLGKFVPLQVKEEMMLVLTRRENEEIVIGDNIRITVSKISGSRVRVAIDAPDEIGVRRGELQGEPSCQTHIDSRGNSEAASLHVAAYHA